MMYRLNRQLLILACMLVMALSVTSCFDDVEFYSFAPVPYEWSKEDTITLSLPDSLQAGQYDWNIEVRNLATYPYKDIWLDMEIKGEKNGVISIDNRTLHLYLTDSTGQWKNPHSLGTFYMSEFPQETPFEVDDSTFNYQISFRHIMSDEWLKGISDIGIQLKR